MLQEKAGNIAGLIWNALAAAEAAQTFISTSVLAGCSARTKSTQLKLVTRRIHTLTL